MNLGIISFPSKSPYLQVFVPIICCKTGKPYRVHGARDQELHSLLHHFSRSRIGIGFLVGHDGMLMMVEFDTGLL